MSQEITATAALSVTKASLIHSQASLTIKPDMTGQGVFSQVVSVTTSEANITVSGITNLGWAYVKNIDTLNYFTLGISATTPTLAALCKLKPGEFALMRLNPGVTLRAQANTGTVKALVTVYED
jgi:hypothetical protein